MEKNFTVGELLTMLQRNQNRIKELEGKKSEFLSALKDIEKEILSLGGNVKIKAERKTKAKKGKKAEKKAKKVAKRAKNDMSLSAYIDQVLTFDGMRVKDLVTAVEAAGYKTNGNLSTMVSVALAKKDNCENVSCGVWRKKAEISAPIAEQTVVATTETQTTNA